MPGTISLIGSGETASTGGQIFETAARQLGKPLKISVLETPAGFETNATRVADRVSVYLNTRLSNYNPQVSQIAARKKGTAFSPDSTEIATPLYDSNMVFFGPGSPTYTVRQLQDSLTWNIIQARHRLGASLVLASAATIAVSALALPVYEIFKVGEDPHWKPGLDLLAPFGLSLVIIPHWNNHEGGDDVDTSRCFIGQERFEQLINELPPEKTILGIDEHTAITIDFEAQVCRVSGVGNVHLLSSRASEDCSAGCEFSIDALGNYRPLAKPETGLPEQVWRQALTVNQAGASQAEDKQPEVPDNIMALVAAREQARKQRNWARADQLRDEISALGWQVVDSKSGPQVSCLHHCNASPPPSKPARKAAG